MTKARERRSAVVCLGAVAPAAMTYARIQRILGAETTFILKDPECFGDTLPPDYSLETEIATALRAADAIGFERFHVLGYSAGGSIALALGLAHPRRVQTLTLVEPAWIGRPDWSDDEAAFVASVDAVMELPIPARGPALLRAMSDPRADPAGVLPDPLPSWLLDRPARFAALWRAFADAAARFDGAASGPLHLPVCGRSHPRFLEAARRLEARTPSASVEVYADCTHLDPPQSREPERFAARLRELWSTVPA
jgi:pimeloyl-ACP methyl ester carboxylesterase